MGKVVRSKKSNGFVDSSKDVRTVSMHVSGKLKLARVSKMKFREGSYRKGI